MTELQGSKAARTWSTRAMLIAGSGWIVAAGVFVLELPAKINSFYDEKDKAAARVADTVLTNRQLTGFWTSENTSVLDEDHNHRLEAMEGGPVYVEMRVSGGDAVGTIQSEGSKKFASFSLMDFTGRVRGGVLYGEVSEIVFGKQVLLATFEVRQDRQSENALSMRVTQQARPYFPTEAILFRYEGEMPESAHGTEFSKAIDEAVAQTRKSK